MPKFESTLRFSSYFVMIQAIILITSVFSVLYLPWAPFSRILLVIIVIGYGIFNFYRQKQWDGISQDEDGWYLKKENRPVNITLAGDSTITPFLTILRFHQLGKRYKQSYMIFKDAMPEPLYRQLTVRLRYFKLSKTT